MLKQSPVNAALSIWPAALKLQRWDCDPLQGLTTAAALFPSPSRHTSANRLLSWTGSAALATPALNSPTPTTARLTIDRDALISRPPLVLPNGRAREAMLHMPRRAVDHSRHGTLGSVRVRRKAVVVFCGSVRSCAVR